MCQLLQFGRELRRLESFILDKISKYRMPGLSLGLLSNGDRWIRTFGYSNLETGSPVRGETLFGIGSITKSFTALAILILAREGLLSPQDPVEDYIDTSLSIDSEPIRIHHLLTHTSGIPATGYAESLLRGFFGAKEYWKPYSNPRDALLYLEKAVREGWYLGKPGQRFFYLNEGYVVLGLIVEAVSGEPYRSFVREKILRELGMNHTCFLGGCPDGLDMATPYAPGSPPRSVTIPSGIEADGGLLSNVVDMLKYVEALSTRSEPVMDSAEIMERAYVKVPWQVLGGESYGYGLLLIPGFDGKMIAGHGGSVLGYTAWMGYIPREGIGVVVMSNTTGYPLMLIGLASLSSIMNGDPYSPAPVRYLELLEKLEGYYEGFEGSVKYRLRIVGSALLAEQVGGFAGQLILVPDEIPEYDDLSRGSVRLWSPYLGGRMIAEFWWSGDRVEGMIDRYRLVKKGGL